MHPKRRSKQGDHIVFPVIGSKTYVMIPYDPAKYSAVLITVLDDWVIWRMVMEPDDGIRWRAIHSRTMGAALKAGPTHPHYFTAYIGFNKLQEIAHYWGAAIINEDGTPFRPHPAPL